MMTTPVAPSHPLRGLQLDPDVPFLWKFYLSSRDLIPPGIPEKSARTNADIDERIREKAREALQSRQAMIGRVRPDRSDTGIPVYQNMQGVQVSSIRAILAHRRYRLSDMHWFEKPGAARGGSQFVVVTTLFPGETTFRARPETLEALRRLARENTWTANVWDNESTQTLNLTARQYRGRPRAQLVVRDGYLKLMDIEQGIDSVELERREEDRVALDIEQLLAEMSRFAF